MEHLSDLDLERYHLGMVIDTQELAALEEHVLSCPHCATRAEESADYVDLMRKTIVEHNLDANFPPEKVTVRLTPRQSSCSHAAPRGPSISGAQ